MFEELKKFISDNDAYLTIIGSVIVAPGIVQIFIFASKNARKKMQPFLKMF